MQKNLDIYEEQAGQAAQKGAQIVVFPENGLQGFNFSRSSISGYLETIPDPEQESWNPCTEPGKHNNTEVLQQLSCMARHHNLYLVANMADLQPCPLTTDPSSSCPSDGHWQFNTNVAFRSDGLLVARYHKYNLFFEEAFDTPPQPEIISFDTPFAGRFGFMICFDILFHEPTITLVEKGVRQLIFPTAWMNTLPLLDSVQFQHAFSLGANVTLLAANLRNDRMNMSGSGIYTPFPATYHHAQKGDPEEGRLLVARVPVLDPLWVGQSVATVTDESTSLSAENSGYCQQKSCVDSPPPETASSIPPSTTTFISTMVFDPFTFVLLNETEGEVKVCNGTFCCYLQYHMLPQGSSKELYALGAFAGMHIVEGRYALQVCALVRCAGLDTTSCGQEVEEAESKMDFLLEGKFGTKYVYPSVLAESSVDASYVAAVYEHNLILNPEPHVPLSRPAALLHMQKNLDIYEEQAARAAQQGAQIVVFPEDGLQGFNFSRSSISGYLETIPDPQQESWNPCTEPGKHNNTEVLQRLSCMARHHNLYLVANMADLQPCPLTTDPSSSCPSDGHWQFNTNVAFRSDGLLVARYHKYNLYFEKAFDTPPQPEIITFDTPFAGRFGFMICFDILFHEPTVTLVEKGVRQLIFPTAWMNQLPLLDMIQFQRAFSLGANVTLLAANIRNDRMIMSGSGIYTPFSATYHHAQKGDPEAGRLLVARVPVLDPLWVEQNVATDEGIVTDKSTSNTATDSGYCHKESCVDSPPPETASSIPPSTTTFISSMMYDPFTFVLLNEREGKVKVCNGTFCCYLQYHMLPQGSSQELYALGAFAGTHTVNGRYALQVCALVRCAGLDTTSCGQEVEEAESKMDFLLEGKFGTKYVYPSVLASKLVLEQPEHVEKAEDGTVSMRHSNMTGGLVTACLYGRMYHLDND
ncbi:biotinidase [Chaetodon auriga]|uniref:biotinidase n=1 Tax=Chaetodon auriga TaxID=39042 RepID=UPI0040331402